MYGTMFSLSRRTFQHNIVYAWDKEGQSNIVEITKKWVDANHLKWLNMDIFLSKFEAWKDADSEWKQSLFAALREMHQAVGINKASTVFWADEEMLAFGNYVSKVKELEQKTQREIEKAKPGNSQVIRPSESLDPRSESVVQDTPRVVPKKRRIRIKKRVKHDWKHKNLSHSPKPESGPEKNIDFSKENKLIQSIIELAKKNDSIFIINNKVKEYVVSKQPDGEYHVYDIRKNNSNIIYRTDINKNVIWILDVNNENKQNMIKWTEFQAQYFPINN